MQNPEKASRHTYLYFRDPEAGSAFLLRAANPTRGPIAKTI